jgi:hypothetical protein
MSIRIVAPGFPGQNPRVNELSEETVGCPYCGETISILVDHSLDEQEYVEDCQVCCRPIIFNVFIDNAGDAAVGVRPENE